VIVVATPVRGTNPKNALVTLGFADFRANLVPPRFAKTAVSFEPVRARNRLAARILQDTRLEKMTHVLWLDADQWADRPEIIQRMIDTREDLVGAPYVGKDYPIKFTHAALPDKKREGDLLEVEGLGFGFTLTSRKCLEEMTKAARIYTDHPNPWKCADLFGLLYTGPTEGDGLLSEDLSFCARWRALGGRVMLWCGGPGHVMHSGGHEFYATNTPGG
jgi:hypothetical protein